MTDEELLELLKTKPDKGINALLKQYGGLVYSAVKRKLSGFGFGDKDIEACAVDTFSDFYMDIDKFDLSKGSIKAWLCVIARHNAIDMARRNAPLPLDEEQNMSDCSLESNLEEQELRKAVLEAVKALDEPDREILLRKFYFGESSKEIAKRLKMTVSNVDTRTSRAVEKLRKSLEDWRK